MEEETTKEDIQPSTSKKESQRTNSGNDLYDEGRHDVDATNSETSVSATYSARSRLDMMDARPEPPKPSLGKRETKAPERKKKGRKGGRVEKRRRSYTRRQLRRAPMRRKPAVRHARAEERRMREHSVSSIFTRLSSRSGSRTPGCVHCGHRCCRRRYGSKVVRHVYVRRRYTSRRYRKRRRIPKKKILGTRKFKKKPKIKFFGRPFTAFSKQLQTGSRSQMLSPLFINTNSTPEEEVTLPPQTYCQVTPEMIFETLRVLNLWKQEVPSDVIMEYIKRNYPVNNVETELNEELKEKLRIACIVGIVTQSSEDAWSLAGELEQRQLSANHVTLFWKAYGDTLKAIPRKEAKLEKDRSELPAEKRRGLDFGDDLV